MSVAGAAGVPQQQRQHGPPGLPALRGSLLHRAARVTRAARPALRPRPGPLDPGIAAPGRPRRRPLCRGGRAAGSGPDALLLPAWPSPARPYVRSGGGAGLGAGAAGAGAGAVAGGQEASAGLRQPSARWGWGTGVTPLRAALRPDSWVSASLRWRKIRLYEFLALKQKNPRMPGRLRVKASVLPTCQRPSHPQTHFELVFAASYCRTCKRCKFVSAVLPALSFRGFRAEQVTCVEHWETS